MAELTQEQHLALFRLQKEALGTWDLRQLKQHAPQDESQVPPHPAFRCPKVSAEDEKRGYVQLNKKCVYIKTGKLSAAIAASTAAIQDLIDVGFSRAEAEDHVFANYGTVAQETLANHKERCAKGGRKGGRNTGASPLAAPRPRARARRERRAPRRSQTQANRAAAGLNIFGGSGSGFAERSKGGRASGVAASAARARGPRTPRPRRSQTVASRAAAGLNAYGLDSDKAAAAGANGGSSKSDAKLKSAANARQARFAKLPPGHVPAAHNKKQCVDPASRLPTRPTVPGRSALRAKRSEAAADLRNFNNRAIYELDGEDRGGPAYRALFDSVLYDDAGKKLTIGALVKKAANAQPQGEGSVSALEASIYEFELAVDVWRLALDSEAKPATPAEVDVFVYRALRGPCAGLVRKAKAARAKFAAAKRPQPAAAKPDKKAKKPKKK